MVGGRGQSVTHDIIIDVMADYFIESNLFLFSIHNLYLELHYLPPMNISFGIKSMWPDASMTYRRFSKIVLNKISPGS